MKSFAGLLSPVVMTLVPMALWAQSGGSIADGKATYVQGAGPTSVGATGGGLSDFRPDGGTTPDLLFQNWWWYRVQGDPRERPFGNYLDGSRNITGSSSFGGNSFTMNWTATEAGDPLFTAQWTATLFGHPDPGIATLVYSFQVTNTSTSPMTFNLFNYLDLDIPTNSGTNTATGDATSMTIVGITHSASWNNGGADNYQVTGFPTVRTLLANGSVDDMNNTGLPFGPGDWTGAVQWVRELAPGESFTIGGSIAAVPEPTTIALAGLGLAGTLMTVRRARMARRRKTKK